MLRRARFVTIGLFLAAAANIVLLAISGSYDVRLGPVHLAAQYLFKPLLYLNAAFLLAIATAPTSSPQPFCAPRVRYWLPAAAIMLVVYAVSFTFNLEFPDWTHREHSIGANPLSFFMQRQGDGYYRPLGFLSLWADNAIFGAALWAYHIQSLALQLLNGFLVVRLARRLGFGADMARWAGLLFIAAPAPFEAVIWPGARFDLLAATFTLIALERAVAGSLLVSMTAYATAVLCKESAYCFPLLICVLFLWRDLFGIRLDRGRMFRIVLAAFAVTIALICARIAVYGNLGGYPDVVHGGTVNFAITARGIAPLFTRLPAALYMVNSVAGMSLWLRLAVVAYVVTLGAALAGGARLGRHAIFLGLAFVAELPAMNIVGWMQYSAQNGRYLYQSAIWVVLAATIAFTRARRAPLLLPALLGCLCAGALWNTLVYVRMLHAVDTNAAVAVNACRNAGCCRALVLEDVPLNLYGANYFGDQLIRNVRRALPATAVRTSGDARAPCTVHLRWAGDHLSHVP